MSCDNVITVQDLETDKKHSTYYREVITGKSGGTGADIDFATNAVTGQTQTTLPKVLSNVGFSPAGFDFTTGGTLTERDKAIFYQADGNWYSWSGALPKVVPPASSPASTGGIADNAWNVSTSSFMYRDWEGFTSELLAQGGVPDNGLPDELGNSKRVDAMRKIFSNVGTVADISAGKFKIGDAVLVADRGHALFEVVSGSSPNGFSSLPAGLGKIAIQKIAIVTALSVGFDNSGAVSPVNADAWDAVIADTSVSGIVFEPGTYFYNRQIVGRTQFQILGAAKQSLQQRTVVFKSNTANIGNGNALLKCAPGTTQIQSFTVNDVTFWGDTSPASGFDLTTIPDQGIYGIDISGVKEGLNLDGCGFRELRAGLAKISGHGYIGEPRLTNQYYKLCYKAWHQLDPTTAADISGTHVYDCNRIGELTQISGNCVRFNNSSYSGESVGLLTRNCVLGGVWIEGFNRVLSVTSGGFLKLTGGHLSETFSSNGATKVMFSLAEGASIVLEGTRLPVNTRLFNFETASYEKYSIEIKETSTATTPFGLLSSDIAYFIARNLNYMGINNEAAYLNVTVRQQVNFGRSGWGSLLPAPISTMPINFNGSVAISVDFNDYLTSDSIFRFGYLEFEIVGVDDTVGGANLYSANIKILKGVSSTWRVDITGPSAASYSAVLSSVTPTTATITLSELHAGIRDMLIQKSASASCKFSIA